MKINNRRIVATLLIVLILACGISGCGSKSESNSAEQKDFSKMDSESSMFKAPPIVIAGDGLQREFTIAELQPQAAPLESVPPVSLPDDLLKPTEPVSLSLKPAVDQDLDFDMLVIRQLVNDDQTYPRRDHIETTVRLADSDDESELAFEIEARRVRVGFQGSSKDLDYDTTNPIIYASNFANAVAGMLQAAIDEPTRVTTDTKGSTVEFSFPSALEQALSESADASRFGTDDAYLREAMRLGIIPLPTEAVSVGDSWESTGNWSRFGPELTLSTTYRLEGLASKNGIECAVISYETTTDGDASPAMRFVNLGYTLQGVAFVELETGQLVQLVNEGNGETDLEIPEEPTRTCELQFRTIIVRTNS